LQHPDSKNKVEIVFKDELKLTIYSTISIESNTLFEINTADVLEHGEERFQLIEGREYEYELPTEYFLKTIPSVVSSSKINPSQGRIKTGNYVGRLVLTVCSKYDIDDIEVAVEIQSYKTDYRKDYRTMLGDITDECTELLMQHSSAVSQRVTSNYDALAKTLYQRFVFIKSVIDSDAFTNAVQRIVSMPVTSWSHRFEDADIRRSRRITASHLKQFASRQDRINHSIGSLKSIPARLTTQIKTDTVDTPENRFVKHVIKEFEYLCGLVCSKSKGEKNKPFIFYEAKALENKFSELLNHNVFREVSPLQSIPLNSPVLQKKEGYRDVLNAWLKYDLAAKLIWNGLDDEQYNVGKRDVATLYEYWLFFKLLRLVENIFNVERTETAKLIEKTKDGLGLKLKQGNHTAISAKYTHKSRELNIKYSFNRSFGKSKYPAGGSWTQQMRPDYTLSIWPSAFSEDDAEKQELIVHIHFDAKYKIEGLKPFKEQIEINADEKLEQKEGRYKRDDLLKMHAYKDAIRRTVGAYVLYPGNKPVEHRGFREIIPGLGAFPVSPSSNGGDIEEIKKFLLCVVDNFSNRASKQERLSYHVYDINKEINTKQVNDVMPEYAVNGLTQRALPIEETTVLVGYVNNDQLDWVKDKKLYNIRMDNKGLKEYDANLVGANYLLLHKKGELITSNIWRIISKAPKLISKKNLVKDKFYPRTPSCEFYLLFELEKVSDDTFVAQSWNVRDLPNYKKNHQSARPFYAFLSDFAKAKTT
jgi:predicted component of viral defense system (DUF524 family)